MLLIHEMNKQTLRPSAPRITAVTTARPRPTAAAALLLATVLSLPFAALALVQAVF